MSARDGGPAFPSQTDTFRTPEGRAVGRSAESGMTLRDYFAAKAMPLGWDAEQKSPTYGGNYGPSYRGAAERAYHMADAMLAARESQP